MSTTPRRPIEFPTDQPGDDAFLAHVQRVLAARAPADETPGPSPPASPAARTEPERPHRLQCGRCGWAIACLAADRDRLARLGCLMCAGGLTDGRPAPEDPANKRQRPRRPIRGGTWVEVWRPGPGRPTDLAVALIDLCAEGVGVWVSEPLRPGEPVEVAVTRPGGGQPVRMTAEVRWCAAGRDWTHRAGLRLGQALTDRDLADLTL